MSDTLRQYLRYITILFCVSLVGLGLHIIDDALVTREPDWYGISVGEFFLACAIIYLILPPIGMWLARRGSLIGLAILLLYAFQALYGAGLNHLRHLLGEFQGSQLLPTVLKSLNIDYAPYLTNHGFLTVMMNMAGLGITPPHTHSLVSNLVVYFNVGVNAALIAFILLAARAWWRTRTITLKPV
ncbi:MAG: hypothetical protein HZB51_14005 [Chloroflexi bacterium]|nr:hypothetical protein [Chloroflexota bacterium]